MHTIYYKGLRIEGTVSHEAATAPSYACGGTPASCEAEIDSIEIDDWDYFMLSGIMGTHIGVLRMLGVLYDLTGEILPTVEDKIMTEWEEDILTALCEA